MPVNDALGTRMKTYYEDPAKTSLIRRMPVAIRVDGKAFHTFTRGFQKPYDRLLMTTMQETMLYLCENIQGCVLGYTQSDEIKAMLLARGIDWEAYATDEKRGSCCVKGLQGWAIDREIPIFRGAAREYIDKLVFVGE